jgi:hypothetical protein
MGIVQNAIDVMLPLNLENIVEANCMDTNLRLGVSTSG